MLASELKALEADGLIIRTDFFSKPLRVEYSLSEKSLSLYPTLVMLSEWGASFNFKAQDDCIQEEMT